MRRRQVLVGGAALLAAPLAGCGHPPNVLGMSEATDEDVAREASREVSTESDAFGTVAAAVREGNTTVTDTDPPVDTDETVAFEGAYYDLSVTETGDSGPSRYEAGIEIDYDPGDVTPVEGEISYADLPAVDREALADLVPPPEDRQGGAGFDFGTEYEYPADAVASSVPVPDQQYDPVTYEGERYRVRVGSRPAQPVEYRVTATEVAASTAAYADRLRERYLFALSGLSDAEREVVETAIEDGYFEAATEPFLSVVDRLRDHRGFEVSEGYGTWLVAYGGTEYVTYAEYPPREG